MKLFFKEHYDLNYYLLTFLHIYLAKLQIRVANYHIYLANLQYRVANSIINVERCPGGVNMLEKDLIELVENIQQIKMEKQSLEIKAAQFETPKKLYNTISAFSNQDSGGTIVFGISEEKNFEIVGVYDGQQLQKDLSELCLQMVPEIRPVIVSTVINGLTVLSCEIPGAPIADRPVYYSGKGKEKGSYVRIGDIDEPMTSQEIYSYEAFRQRIKDDIRPVMNATIDDLNMEKLDGFLNTLASRKPLMFQRYSKERILDLIGVTNSGVPTISGLLVFGDYPQLFLPKLCITATLVNGTRYGENNSEIRFLDNEKIDGNIENMIEKAIIFILRNTRTKTVISSKTGKREDIKEYPVIALREIILNSLVHRDYSIHSEGISNSIEIYEDRIEIKNSGGLYGQINIKQLEEGRPDQRNVYLSDILEELHITENRYTGIRTIKEELRKYNLPDPEFSVKKGDFIVTLRNRVPELKDRNEILIDFCKDSPKSREEIIEKLGINRNSVMSDYVYPLIEKGKLFMTIPEKPKSSKQKYYSAK